MSAPLTSQLTKEALEMLRATPDTVFGCAGCTMTVESDGTAHHAGLCWEASRNQIIDTAVGALERVAELEAELSGLAGREETHLLKIHKLDAENAAMKRGTSALGWCFKTSSKIYSPAVMEHCDRPTRHRGPHSWEIDEARAEIAALTTRLQNLKFDLDLVAASAGITNREDIGGQIARAVDVKNEARRHLAALVEAFAGDDRDVQRICEAARAYLRERETQP